MGKLRVLVVEDSTTVRAYLCSVLSSDPDIEVIADVGDGRKAVELCSSLRPDVVTLDMMLPTLTGLAATEQILAYCPTPILIVSSSFNRGELFKTYEALAAGAVDVLEKPTGAEPEGAWERRFLAMIKLVARIRVITHPRARLAGLRLPALETAAAMPRPQPPRARYDLVAIGASTGGPGAIVQVLRGLPSEFRIPILVVLHINEPFGTAFAEWLDGQTGRRVTHARDGMLVASAIGRAVVAPGGQHLLVHDGRLHLTSGPERHSCKPSVDVLFESVAAEYGPRAVACLLTGMGRDGAQGLLQIRRAGGMTIAQDEATSAVYGMPREAALLGAAEQIVGIGDIAGRLAALNGVCAEALS